MNFNLMYHIYITECYDFHDNNQFYFENSTIQIKASNSTGGPQVKLHPNIYVH